MSEARRDASKDTSTLHDAREDSSGMTAALGRLGEDEDCPDDRTS